MSARGPGSGGGAGWKVGAGRWDPEAEWLGAEGFACGTGTLCSNERYFGPGTRLTVTGEIWPPPCLPFAAHRVPGDGWGGLELGCVARWPSVGSALQGMKGLAWGTPSPGTEVEGKAGVGRTFRRLPSSRGRMMVAATQVRVMGIEKWGWMREIFRR